MEKYSYVSLFSGCGGLDIGLEQAGMKASVCQEMDPYAVKTLRANGRYVVEGNILKLIHNDPSCSFLGSDRLFAVVGGPPCQSFSGIGKRRGMKDPRGRLYRAFIHVLKARNPRYFIYENVASLAWASMKKSLDKILADFRGAGYAVIHGVLNAADYGVPQTRERLIIIGSRDENPPALPVPTHAGKWLTFGDAVEGLKDTGERAKLSNRVMQYISQVPPGGYWKDLPTEKLRSLAKGKSKGGGCTGIGRRLSFFEPAPTATASGPQCNATLMVYPTENRTLTVLEYARIQGFPDSYRFIGSVNRKYRQIGNAVPIALGKALGRTLTFFR